MIDLTKLQANEAERLAYIKGFPMAAELFARIAELEAELEDHRQALYQCLPFFEDWQDENGIYKPGTMAFMIRMIRKTLKENEQ